MKNLKSFLVMLFVVYAMHAYTAVLIVNENGLGGAYTTISAALAAASSGDRILVYPKADGAYYNESPFVSLKNIDLLNAIEGQKFKVSGNISLDSGCVISGADVIGIIFDGGGVNSNVHIINCKILYGGIFASGESTKTFVENDSIINGSIRIYKGRVSGCHVSGNTGPNGAIELSNSSGVPVSNDTAFIVGNKIEISANQFNGPQIGIRCISPKVFSYVSNNYITLASNNSSIAVFGIYIEVIKSDPNIRNLIINNTVREIGPYSQASYGFVHVSGPLMGIYNNISSSTGTGYGYGFYGGNQTEMDFKYNYSHNSPVAFYNMPSHVTNISNSNTTVDLITGSLIAGSDAINGGDPSPGMFDLDLTRNDAGCYGGSYSLANFISAETGARVLWMEAPRFIYSHQGPISIKGEGIDK